MKKIIPLVLLANIICFTATAQQTNSNKKQSLNTKTAVTNPLPSWNEGASKQGIINFVTKVTKAGSADFIPVADRIACFDNDGTLWSEKPLYFQFQFALERLKEIAPQHPEWQTQEPFSSVLKGDLKTALAGGDKALLELVMATQTGMSASEFTMEVKNWMATARHPRFKKPYNELTFQPMLELLSYLRANGFKTYICSGGDEAFMRPWTEQAYGIPTEQIIGTSMKVVYEITNDSARLMRMPELGFLNDGKGKPVGINNKIGKRPVFTAGNSDGDYEMLQWTSLTTQYPHFEMIVHHTDSVREWAYDRDSDVGHLAKGLDDAPKYGWMIVDMKNDWKVIFVGDKK